MAAVFIRTHVFELRMESIPGPALPWRPHESPQNAMKQYPSTAR